MQGAPPQVVRSLFQRAQEPYVSHMGAAICIALFASFNDGGDEGDGRMAALESVAGCGLRNFRAQQRQFQPRHSDGSEVNSFSSINAENSTSIKQHFHKTALP